MKSREFQKVTCGSIMMLALAATASAQPSVRANLLQETERKPTPDFVLKDARGKAAKLSKYRGKVVLLDFWATWCTGCKREIPWFVEFQKAYGTKRFAVVGVSMDEDGWKALKPFLAEHPISYRMLLGDSAMAKQYGIANLPDTFLIDRKGRVAAVYREGLVDRGDVAANIASMMAEP